MKPNQLPKTIDFQTVFSCKTLFSVLNIPPFPWQELHGRVVGRNKDDVNLLQVHVRRQNCVLPNLMG